MFTITNKDEVDRRYKVLWIDPNLLMDLRFSAVLAKDTIRAVTVKGLPEDAVVQAMCYDPMKHAVGLRIWSSTFDEVPPENTAPELQVELTTHYLLVPEMTIDKDKAVINGKTYYAASMFDCEPIVKKKGERYECALRLTAILETEELQGKQADQSPVVPMIVDAGELIHYAETPFIAVCGADRQDQRTTTVKSNTTCPLCREKL